MTLPSLFGLTATRSETDCQHVRIVFLVHQLTFPSRRNLWSKANEKRKRKLNCNESKIKLFHFANEKRKRKLNCNESKIKLFHFALKGIWSVVNLTHILYFYIFGCPQKNTFSINLSGSSVDANDGRNLHCIEVSGWRSDFKKRLGSKYGCPKQQNAFRYFVKIFKDCILFISFLVFAMDDFSSGRVC